MICKNCGHENEDGKKICENCGQELEKSDQRDRRRQRRSQKADDEKIVIKRRENNRKEKDMDLITVGMIFGGILIFAVAAIIFSYFINLSSNKTEKAPKQVEEKVEDNKDLYKQALTKVEEAIKDEDYLSALKVLNAIPEAAGDFYDKAQKQIADMEKDVEAKINELVEAGDEDKARDLADEYLKANADAKNIKELRANMKDKEETPEKDEEKETDKDTEESTDEETDKKENTKKESKNYDKEYLRRTNSYGQNGNPAYTDVYSESDFLNKTVKIDANMGEIRTEPNLNSGVAGYVNRNETYKVSEVHDDGGRYWLNIGDGWISSKLVTGEFRD